MQGNRFLQKIFELSRKTFLPTGPRSGGAQLPLPTIHCEESGQIEVFADDAAILSTSSTIPDHMVLEVFLTEQISLKILSVPSASSLSAPRTRTATICGDATDALGRHQSMLEHRHALEKQQQRPRFGSLMSLDPTILAAATVSLRRRSPWFEKHENSRNHWIVTQKGIGAEHENVISYTFYLVFSA
jgi:hypothetical protein